MKPAVIANQENIASVSKPSSVNIKHKLEYLQNFPQKIKRSHQSVIRVKKLIKNFKVERKTIPVLKKISTSIYYKEFVIIHGPSGCGKSTLLHSILGLEHPTKGAVYIKGKNIYKMQQNSRAIFRHKTIGTVFQQSNWIKSLNVIENVSYPLFLSGISKKDAFEVAYLNLQKVGLQHLSYSKPVELSGGEQQRVSLARSLVLDPKIIIADEPTGNLDSASGTKVMEILTRLNREENKVIVMVTHDTSFLPLANRVIGMLDGKIVFDNYD